jgi:hypothetical protein
MIFIRPLPAAMVVVAVAVSAASAQPKTDKAPMPLVKPAQVPGYTPRLVEGFTVVLSDETMKHLDEPKFKKKPLEVLEQEFKAITAAMPAKNVKILQRLLFFVEWDERKRLSNGVPGGAVAVYYGGHQLNMLAKGMPPLKAKNITVLSMRSLTAEHQPEVESGRCVLLHEIAHAVHDQLIGFENPTVFAAYRQARERKLVDPEAYAATNEAEFFAEMSCAYYDQLDYHPKTREALKKLDPVTYKIMEEAWGKAKLPFVAGAKSKNLGTPPPLEKLDLGGTTLQGKITTHRHFKDHPAVILFWNAEDVSSLSGLGQLQTWDNELGSFGLETLAVHQTAVLGIDLKQILQTRGIKVAVNDGIWGPRSLVEDFKNFPLCLVYAADGRGVFMGSPFDAESYVRSAVGEALVADLGEAPKGLTPIVDALRTGKMPASQFAKLTTASKSKDEELAKPAKTLLERLTERGRKTIEETEPKLKEEPYDSYLTLERVVAAYRDSPVGTKAAALVYQLKSNKTVAAELRARPQLEKIQKIESELVARLGPYNPASPRFRLENGPVLRQLAILIQQMQQSYPNTRATEQAQKIGGRFGI